MFWIRRWNQSKPGYIEKEGKKGQKEFWHSCSFIFRTRESRVGKFKFEIIYIILNFPAALDFLVWKIKEWEFQNYFCPFLTYFYIYILDETNYKEKFITEILSKEFSFYFICPSYDLWYRFFLYNVEKLELNLLFSLTFVYTCLLYTSPSPRD